MDKLDFFICHSSDDKNSFVRGLADHLINFGSTVFYDEYSINLGDSIFDTINKGIAAATCGVIVISPSFITKGWTNSELATMFGIAKNRSFKLFIIYHEIEFEAVAEAYPLLRDIKGLKSSIGVEQVAFQLLKAIGKTASVKYITIEHNQENLLDGITLSTLLGTPIVLDQNLDKVYIEIGRKNQDHSRLKIYLYKNSRLYFELTDSEYHKYSLSAPWSEGDTKLIVCTVDIANETMYYMINGVLIDQIKISGSKFDDDFLTHALCIIGCSLELTHASPYTLGSFVISKALTIDQASSLSEAFNTLNKDIGRYNYSK